MTAPPEDTSDNLVRLDLSAFSRNDIRAVAALGKKLRLLYRWFRSERATGEACDAFVLYSGARGRTPYSAYRVERHRDGSYVLLDHRAGTEIATARTIGAVLDALPDDFYYSG